MIQVNTAKILVVSKNEEDQQYLEGFFSRTPFPKPDFVINKPVYSDSYDLIIFNAKSIPAVSNPAAMAALPDPDQNHLYLLQRYLEQTSKYILFFGEYYHNLNRERCPSANSKFSLYARLREMIDFLNDYKME